MVNRSHSGGTELCQPSVQGKQSSQSVIIFSILANHLPNMSFYKNDDLAPCVKIRLNRHKRTEWVQIYIESKQTDISNMTDPFCYQWAHICIEKIDRCHLTVSPNILGHS